MSPAAETPRRDGAPRGTTRGGHQGIPPQRAQEQRVRRLAHRHGLWVEKSRRRPPQAEDSGGYRLVEVPHHAVVYGGIPHPYSATLDDLEHFLSQLPPPPPPYNTD